MSTENHTDSLVKNMQGSIYADALNEVRLCIMDREEHGTSPVERDANARRFAASWNACAGIPTEALKQGVVKEALDMLEIFFADPDLSFEQSVECGVILSKAGR